MPYNTTQMSQLAIKKECQVSWTFCCV